VVTFIVGHPPGGGYDRIARLLAKCLPKYIPGKPTFIVQNMPGGSTVIAANHIYNVAKPDGLTMAIIDRATTFMRLLKVGGIKFDLTKFAWIGSPTIESYVLVIRSDLPSKNIQDLMGQKKPIFLGSTGPTSINAPVSLMLKKYLGMNVETVEYRGTADVYLAIERKEVDGMVDAWNSVKIRVERGDVRPVLRTRIVQRGTENLPINEDLTTDPTGKKIMAMHAIVGGAGRFCIAPPRTPEEALRILRNAFARAIKEDPELRENAEKLMVDFEYVPAERCLEIINFILNQPADVVKEFSKFVAF